MLGWGRYQRERERESYLDVADINKRERERVASQVILSRNLVKLYIQAYESLKLWLEQIYRVSKKTTTH